jgi:hypothetical protein
VVEKEVRLIDANALLEQTELICGRYEVKWTDNRVMVWIDNAPTIDPESLRPKGKWLKSEWGYPDRTLTCSACGFEYDSAYYKQKLFRYCPNCGAKMEG